MPRLSRKATTKKAIRAALEQELALLEPGDPGRMRVIASLAHLDGLLPKKPGLKQTGRHDIRKQKNAEQDAALPDETTCRCGEPAEEDGLCAACLADLRRMMEDYGCGLKAWEAYAKGEPMPADAPSWVHQMFRWREWMKRNPHHPALAYSTPSWFGNGPVPNPTEVARAQEALARYRAPLF